MEVADVVVVHVREDDVAHGLRADAKQLQRLRRAAQERAVAFLGHLGGEAGVDDEGAGRTDRDPGVVIHRHRRIVRVAADEIVAAASAARGVAQRMDLVFREPSVHA